MELTGLATGIDTAKIVQQLMAIEGRHKAQLQQTKKDKESTAKVWDEIKSHLSDLNASVDSLATLKDIDSFKSSISDADVLGVSVSDSAQEGSYSIEVGKLATSERIVHGGNFMYATDYVSEGNFIYTYDNKEVEIAVGANTTLEDLVNLINNSSDNPGVRASLLSFDDGTGREHLVLSGTDSGSDYAIKVRDSNSQALKSQKYEYTDTSSGDTVAAGKDTKLSQLSDFDGLVGSTLTITATDNSGASMNVDFDITEQSTLGQLVDAMQRGFGSSAGVTLEDGVINVLDTVSGSSSLSVSYVNDSSTTVDFSVATTGGSTVSGMTEFTDASAFTVAQAASDSQVRVDGFPAGDWITSSSNSVDGVIEGVTLDLTQVTEAGKSVTLNISRDRSKLKENVKAMVDSYNKAVSHLKDVSKYDPATKKAGPLIGDITVRNLLSDLGSNFLGTAVGFNDSDTYSMASQIGIGFNRDGLLELDEDVFDSAVDDDFNAVLDLLGSSGKGRITGDNSSNFSFDLVKDYTKPGDYEISAVYDGTSLTSAQIRRVGDTTWHDADIIGGKIIGSITAQDSAGNYYPERGLQIDFDPGSLTSGTYNTVVSIKQGVAGSLSDMVDRYTDGSDSILSIKKSSLDKMIQSIQDSIDRESTRLDKKESRMKLKYARLEAQMQQLQQSMSAAGILPKK